MSMYPSLEESIEAAREGYLAAHPEMSEDEAIVNQFCMQKYVMQDGEIMWQVEFLETESEQGECPVVCISEAAQAIFDGDFDENELRREWLKDNTLYEWDDGEFQYEPPLDSEEGRAAASEWDDNDEEGFDVWR